MTDNILTRSMPLVFERYGAKLHAKTPAGGLQWGEHGGLAEWRNGILIRYSGGDQQASGGGGFYTRGSGSQDPQPCRLGFDACLDPARMS